MGACRTLKFACNIGTMFPVSMALRERLQQTTKHGFKSIEVAFPYIWSTEEWETALNQYPVHVSLINTPKGEAGQPGLAACRDQREHFLLGIRKGVEYCKALRCSQLHIMAGNEAHFEGQKELFLSNLREASGLLQEHKIVGLLETISGGVIPGYFLNDVQKTLALLDEIDCNNIFFQFDVYHMGMLGYSDDEMLNLFDENFSKIKHIQVAQTPKRDELTAPGDVDYTVIFNHFVKKNYGGDIGLEFKPSSFDEHSVIQDLLTFLDKF